ncbi:helix-turn-helix domain-containing protein [Siphonobacter sp. SORGH_AS_1065]|uniref:winged helix-turn-helix transcriptional regulator n=1 Tax=Siphonobacter sp. SORGH_AS_1065 TaxID=3041795 RepID=UPI0027811A43|nr:helix-turn-helix domain-containing protein [Siphonobacter sp. SORGH_AS_1065]MDQ1086614.1 DNA-binding HxlR family transcriptional regulator [Siphonobacter sp. SORGH_AS_1065]
MSSKIKESSTNYRNLRVLSEACEINDVLKKISPRWKMIILYDIANGYFQFSKLKAKLPGISDQILGKRLRELEEDGCISRISDSSTVPIQTHYKVTAKGDALLEIMIQLHQWGLIWENPDSSPVR